MVLAGLTRDLSRWTQMVLSQDRSRGHARFASVSSNDNDFAELYPFRVIQRIDTILATNLSGNGVDSVFAPRRILILYVPSKDSDSLIFQFGLACFMQPLRDGYVAPSSGSSISWRHNKAAVPDIVRQALKEAIRSTDALKVEISDKRMSPLSLPARNFRFPAADSTIETSYRACVKGEMSFDQLRSELSPKRFTREQLPTRAFKGNQGTDNYFQDASGRIFPPDNHGRVRYPSDPKSEPLGEHEAISSSDARRILEQRYRFGVIVRDGNVHYDVQYEVPRQLRDEAMYCASIGDVLVTGSHANVGVNDVIWTPGGSKVPRYQTK